VAEQATGDAQRFRSVLTEYSKAPQVTRDRLYREAMQDIYSNTSKVLIDTKNSSSLLYLPLEQLLKQGGAASTAAGAPPAPVVTAPAESAPAPAADARSRDSLRNRESR
jgi:membrane protease subunit HflK